MYINSRDIYIYINMILYYVYVIIYSNHWDEL